MTINHEHKLPELSVIPTEELTQLRAALVENARQINRLKEDNERPSRLCPPPVGYQVGELYRLRTANVALLEDVTDLRERLANRDIEVAIADGKVSDLRLEVSSLKASNTQLRVSQLSDEDAKLLGIKRTPELEREIWALKVDVQKLETQLDFTRADAAKHSDRANRIIGQLNEADRSRDSWQKRAQSAEDRVVGLERKLVETRARIYDAEMLATQRHNSWLDEQLSGPGLELPNGRYMMESNVGDRLRIKKTTS